MAEETRVETEYRVVGKDKLGRTLPILYRGASKPSALDRSPSTWPAYTDVRVQARTVTFEPWEDVAE